MNIRNLLFVLLTLLTFSGVSLADAPLKSKLGLSVDQAKQVQVIQKKYRPDFRAKRQELKKEQRKLRRARADNDSNAIAELEPVTATLAGELKQIRENENAEIRQVLTPEQNKKFDDVLKERRAMVGSSRDEKEY
jgi:Spy/CpxP family protein refolding chaperone